jgi:hypothetical protein
MAGVSAVLFPRCRICHGDISMIPTPRLDTCATCSDARDVERWSAAARDAQASLEAAERDLVDAERAGRRSRRRARGSADKARERERRAAFRLLSAQLICAVRLPDDATLGQLAGARCESGFGRWDPEPRRRFAAYVASLLDGDALSEYDFEDITRVAEPMTGSDLTEVRDVYVDVLIGLANGDVLFPVEPRPPLVLPPGETLWMSTPAGLWEPMRLIETQTSRTGLSPSLGLGAQVGIERAHAVTSERPGSFQQTADGVLAVTSRGLIFVGGRNISIDHADVVGLDPDGDGCVVHDRHAPVPIRFRAAGGWAAVAAAYVNAGIRRLH